ncbi:MAG TPA: M15 family peptidase [Candidatus Omnitrophica bacterium]|nr:M15 family peptidase [Candidatus Omnitrophota bacterium]
MLKRLLNCLRKMEPSNVYYNLIRENKMVQQQQLFTQNVAKLILRASTLGIGLTIGDAYRSHDQQYLYFNGKTISPEGKLVDTTPHSWTMQSNHLRRLAIDFNFFIDGKLTYDVKLPQLIELGNYWESLDKVNRWGGFWVRADAPHFEMNI